MPAMGLETFEKVKEYTSKFCDDPRITQAFVFAADRYGDTDADLDYLLKVLDVILPLRPDPDTIIAVILHDLYLLSFIPDQIVKDSFGQGTLSLLQGLMKLNSLNYAENDKRSQLEVLRKMFLTMARDLRVILIWLSCRLVKMENLENDKEKNYLIFARETMDVYVPIAARFGVYRLKTRLEDLAFQYIHPKAYNRINAQVENFEEKSKEIVEQIKSSLDDFLWSRGIKAEVVGRLKSIYSIYRKLKKRDLDKITDLFDFLAMRVILPDEFGENREEIVDNLYAVLGLIHSEWRPLSNRFKDYVAVPKSNGYRSLHTVVVGLTDDPVQPVEVQIRNRNMHREAEYGFASHWFYKDKKGGSAPTKIDYQVEWIRGLEKIHQFFGDESEMMKEVEVDIFKDRIFVLTPRGEVKDLPFGSCPIDFAYSIHTEVGNHCVMAKVNDKVVSLDYRLKNGDVVEIVVKKNSSPKLGWLSFVKSSFARNKIRLWFNSLNKENHVKEGRLLLNNLLAKQDKVMLDQKYSILRDYNNMDLSLPQREHLIEQVGKGMILASDVLRKVFPYERKAKIENELKQDKEEKKFVNNEQILIGGEDGLPVKIAACCKPQSGDRILGYVTRGNRVSVHKQSCHLLTSLNSERLITASWKHESKPEQLSLWMSCVVISRIGLIHDISAVFYHFGIDITDVSIKKVEIGIRINYFFIDKVNEADLPIIMEKLGEIEGVQSVKINDEPVEA
jgi:GTP diphosphokinase / guanosine-3',5'-bis(diphosphate) 3'-diphosphatase